MPERPGRWHHRFPALAAASLVACPAHAHGLAGGSAVDELYAGFGAPLDVPAAMLLIAAAGLCAGLWDPNRFPRLGWALLGGAVAGPAIALALAQSAIAIPGWPPLLLAVVFAVMAALARSWPIALMHCLMLATGALAVLATLIDHSVDDLTWCTGAGIAAGVVFFTAAAAAIFALARMLLPSAIASLGLRILASWIGAIAILLLAFSLRGVPG